MSHISQQHNTSDPFASLESRRILDPIDTMRHLPGVAHQQSRPFTNRHLATLLLQSNHPDTIRIAAREPNSSLLNTILAQLNNTLPLHYYYLMSCRTLYNEPKPIETKLTLELLPIPGQAGGVVYCGKLGMCQGWLSFDFDEDELPSSMTPFGPTPRHKHRTYPNLPSFLKSSWTLQPSIVSTETDTFTFLLKARVEYDGPQDTSEQYLAEQVVSSRDRRPHIWVTIGRYVAFDTSSSHLDVLSQLLSPMQEAYDAHQAFDDSAPLPQQPQQPQQGQEDQEDQYWYDANDNQGV